MSIGACVIENREDGHGLKSRWIYNVQCITTQNSTTLLQLFVGNRDCCIIMTIHVV